MNTEPNPRAGIGGNNPPQTPFDAISAEINDLFEEAMQWLDGAPVDNQDLADGLANLVTMIRDAGKRAEALRKAEVKPFDDAKKAVQDRFAPLIADTKGAVGKVHLALDACKKALAPWLLKLDQEKAEAAAQARREAEEAQRRAQEAAKAADPANLADRAQVEALAAQAKKAGYAAKTAESNKAHAGSVGRSTHLRTTYRAKITDMHTFARHVWGNHQVDMSGFLTDLAQKFVNRGLRDIPGVEVQEEKGVV